MERFASVNVLSPEELLALEEAEKMVEEGEALATRGRLAADEVVRRATLERGVHLGRY